MQRNAKSLSHQSSSKTMVTKETLMPPGTRRTMIGGTMVKMGRMRTKTTGTTMMLSAGMTTAKSIGIFLARKSVTAQMKKLNAKNNAMSAGNKLSGIQLMRVVTKKKETPLMMAQTMTFLVRKSVTAQMTQLNAKNNAMSAWITLIGVRLMRVVTTMMAIPLMVAQRMTFLVGMSVTA